MDDFLQLQRFENIAFTQPSSSRWHVISWIYSNDKQPTNNLNRCLNSIEWTTTSSSYLEWAVSTPNQISQLPDIYQIERNDPSIANFPEPWQLPGLFSANKAHTNSRIQPKQQVALLWWSPPRYDSISSTQLQNAAKNLSRTHTLDFPYRWPQSNSPRFSSLYTMAYSSSRKPLGACWGRILRFIPLFYISADAPHLWNQEAGILWSSSFLSDWFSTSKVHI